MRPREALLVASCIAIVLASLAWPTLEAQLGFRAFNIVYAVEFGLYALALAMLWRPHGDARDVRRELVIVLLGALAMRLALVWQPPFLSDDVYRYVWDGKVQAAGINPYRYVPGAPELASLRDELVFPNINRRDYAPTIYPPAAQLTFLLTYYLGGGTVVGAKVVMVAADLMTVGMLARLLVHFGQDPRRVVVYAWHPLACWEVAHSGHLDAVAVALVVGALLCSQSARRGTAGALLGLATLVKIYPALLVAALARRGGVRFLAAFGLVFLLYLPYLSVGNRVLGFLPMYMQEEGIHSGDRFVLLQIIRLVAPLPTWAFVAGAGLVTGFVALHALRRKAPDARGEARDAATLAALALVFGTPHYAWYSMWLVALVTVAPRWAWFYLASASALLYYDPHSPTARLAFHALQFVPLALLLATELRARRTGEPSPAAMSRTTTGSPSGER